MGGLKRKIDTGKKIENKDPRAVTFSKRRKGLFSKASELCLLSDAQIAILATPVSSNSHASFYSFGHSSVDNVVSAFLAGQTPSRDDDDDEKLGFWWEDESLANSQNPEELGCAIDSMRKMLHDLKELQNKQRVRVDVEEKEKAGPSHVTHQPNDLEELENNKQRDLVEVEKENNNNNALSGNVGGGLEDFDQLIDYAINSDVFNDLPSIDSDFSIDVDEKEKGGSHVTHLKNDLKVLEGKERDLVEVDKENNNNALRENVGGCNQELEDFDQFIDYSINSDFFNEFITSIDSDFFTDLPSIDSVFFSELTS
ncbi:PREDICTED: agamous-like MADS-box protein AGL97 [Camelina sativa]|uniref:Agamous-like MADS-box protein AGL97 n=1 Tax=Camelina sativa TaxID=90675 RepID=A0ABM0ZC52_CAMSA|nr:PREDICTED: agamous-like MADS-box protein AGL97 [Camelina sativa]